MAAPGEGIMTKLYFRHMGSGWGNVIQRTLVSGTEAQWSAPGPDSLLAELGVDSGGGFLAPRPRGNLLYRHTSLFLILQGIWDVLDTYRRCRRGAKRWVEIECAQVPNDSR